MQTASLHEPTEESVDEKQKDQQYVKSVGWIEKGTGQHQSNTVYESSGLCPTLNAVSYKEPVKVVECIKI